MRRTRLSVRQHRETVRHNRKQTFRRLTFPQLRQRRGR